MLTGSTFEYSGKQKAYDFCGDKTYAIEHATVSGQIAGIDDRTVVVY